MNVSSAKPPASATLEEIVESSRATFRTVEEMVASVIRNAIMAGIFAPGERLPQDRLAGLLDVSRMPIRAALRQLESEGLVEMHAHRGATVRSLSPEEISDLYEMRILIETFALRKTVMAITEGELAQLAKLAEELPTAADGEIWSAARQDFYRSLYSIGNTPRVVSTIMQFRAEVSRYTMGLADLRSTTHHELLSRVRLRDPDLAAAWLESHLREIAQELRRQVSTPDPASS
jgi:DNA-binding GntR family transcriptional regulator